MPRLIGGGSPGGRRGPRFVALRPSENSTPKRSLSSSPSLGPPRNCIIIWCGSMSFAAWWSLETSLNANPVEWGTTSVTASASVSVFARNNRIGTANAEAGYRAATSRVAVVAVQAVRVGVERAQRSSRAERKVSAGNRPQERFTTRSFGSRYRAGAMLRSVVLLATASTALGVIGSAAASGPTVAQIQAVIAKHSDDFVLANSYGDRRHAPGHGWIDVKTGVGRWVSGIGKPS